MDLTTLAAGNPFVWGMIGVVVICVVYLAWAYFTGRWPF